MVEPVVAVTTETAVVANVEPTTLNDNGGKPAIDPEYEVQFAALMLEEKQTPASPASQPVNGKPVEPPPAELAEAVAAGTTVH